MARQRRAPEPAGEYAQPHQPLPRPLVPGLAVLRFRRFVALGGRSRVVQGQDGPLQEVTHAHPHEVEGVVARERERALLVEQMPVVAPRVAANELPDPPVGQEVLVRREDERACEGGKLGRDLDELTGGAHRREGEEKVPVHAVLLNRLLVVERVHHDRSHRAADEQRQRVVKGNHQVVPEAVRLDAEVALLSGRDPPRLPGHQRVGQHERPAPDIHQPDPVVPRLTQPAGKRVKVDREDGDGGGERHRGSVRGEVRSRCVRLGLVTER
mmetsp:Transcript_6623/g.29157  ORF Transcript_6623/g.29157 Transcript_6623/m.29157 type:complete len:269 (+) Transcript_6623:1904-2710(+)